MSAIRQVKRSIRKARRERNREVTKSKDMYQRGVGDINYIGAEVGDYLGNMNSRINSGYDQAGSEMAAARTALQTQLGQTTERNAGEASSELARLGISASGLGSIREDSNFAQMIAQKQGTDEQANNTSARSHSNAIGELLLGMNQGQRQSALGKLLNARNDDITDIRSSFRESRQSALEMINDIRRQQAVARRRSSSYGGGYSSGGYSSSGSGNKYADTAEAQEKIAKVLVKRRKTSKNPLLQGAPSTMESSLLSLFTAKPLG